MVNEALSVKQKYQFWVRQVIFQTLEGLLLTSWSIALASNKVDIQRDRINFIATPNFKNLIGVQTVQSLNFQQLFVKVFVTWFNLIKFVKVLLSALVFP